MVVYKITNLKNGKIYVGQTIRTLAARISSYQREIKQLKFDTLILRAMRKHGINSFCWEIIDNASSSEELNEKEKYWIRVLDARNTKIGYNLSEGGRNGAKAESTKRKISQALKGRERPLSWSQNISRGRMGKYCGENNPMWGKASPRRKKIRCQQTGIIYNSITEASQQLGIKHQSISRMLNGRRNLASGLSFETYNG